MFNFLVQLFYGYLVQWYKGSVVHWSSDSMVFWIYGSGSQFLWFPGPWFYGFLAFFLSAPSPFSFLLCPRLTPDSYRVCGAIGPISLKCHDLSPLGVHYVWCISLISHYTRLESIVTMYGNFMKTPFSYLCIPLL